LSQASTAVCDTGPSIAISSAPLAEARQLKAMLTPYASEGMT
jgi:hypothetical protein